MFAMWKCESTCGNFCAEFICLDTLMEAVLMCFKASLAPVYK